MDYMYLQYCWWLLSLFSYSIGKKQYRKRKYLLINTLFVCSLFVIAEPGCTERFMDFDLVKYRAGRIDISRIGNDLDDKIRILTEYQFNCSTTNIISVIVGGDLRTINNNRQLFPNVQIWRPEESDPNRYDLVPDSERTIYYSTNNVSTNGVFEYPLDPPIPVQSGDILAISQPSQGDSIFRVYYIQGDINFDSYAVSFDSSTVDLSGSPITSDLILVYPITGELYHIY